MFVCFNINYTGTQGKINAEIVSNNRDIAMEISLLLLIFLNNMFIWYIDLLLNENFTKCHSEVSKENENFNP